MDYQIMQTAICFTSAGRKLYVDLLSENVVHVYHNPAHLSATLLAFRTPAHYAIEPSDDGYVIKTSKFLFRVSSALQVSASNLQGEELFEETTPVADPRRNETPSDLPSKEGHVANGQTAFFNPHYFTLHEGEHFYGLGDHIAPLDKREYRFVNYNTDYPQAHEETVPSLYKDFPFFLVKRGANCIGFYLDNSYATLFDFGTDQKTYSFAYEGGDDDFYFLYGPTPKDVVSEYSRMLGRCPMPLRWSLGNQQSRWSYANEASVLAVADNYQKADIPLEAIHLDIDYMEGYRIFTVSGERFPDFAGFVSALNKRGIKVITIVDPGIKVDPDYPVYQEAIKNSYVATLNGQVYVNAVWPGDSVYPAFNDAKVRAWWADKIAHFVSAYGLGGIWCDMNEPASFKGPLPPEVNFAGAKHEEIHNLYGHDMAKATFEGIKKATAKRPYVITRACCSGTENYSTVWTGDNQSIWSNLRMLIPQEISLGLCAMPFVGSDVGGFNGDCPSELMNRWIEVAIFSPLLRNHSSCGSSFQEPYRFDEKTLQNYRKWVYFRYRIVPYLYDLFYEHTQNGLPLLRPLFLEYPLDPACETRGDEFLVGSSLLVAPVVDPGVEERLVYFPLGKWYAFDSGKEMSGTQKESCPIDQCLLYAKEGAIIPLYPSLTKNLDSEPEELVLRLFPGNGSFLHYQDDGSDYAYERGEYNLYLFTNTNGILSLKMLHEGYPKYKRIRVVSPSGESILSF
jgi:alpha-glucosidase